VSAIEKRLAEAGLTIPTASAPVANYVLATRAGPLVFTAGQLPMSDGVLIATGLVGSEVSLETAVQCASQCALNALAAAASVCDLGDVEGVARLTGYVASAAGFTDQPLVIDAASEVLVAAFGDAGRHAREAVGVAALPLGAPIEVSLVLSVRT